MKYVDLMLFLKNSNKKLNLPQKNKNYAYSYWFYDLSTCAQYNIYENVEINAEYDRQKNIYNIFFTNRNCHLTSCIFATYCIKDSKSCTVYSERQNYILHTFLEFSYIYIIQNYMHIINLHG